MTLSISLSAHAERLLRKQAAERGLSPGDYAAELVEAALAGPRSWREAMAPAQEAFDGSRVSEAEMDHLLEKARDAAWDKRRNNAS